MSNPSFSNIDMWLFELAEGNLSPEQIEQLELFLLNHPELDVDRDVWEMAKVEKEAVVYPHTADLERKRRPVALFAYAAAFLLLIGSSSYVIWNNQYDGFSSDDLAVQNEQVKSELLDQIRKSKERTTNQMASQNELESIRGDARNLETTFSSNDISMNDSQNDRNVTTNIASLRENSMGISINGNANSSAGNHRENGQLSDATNMFALSTQGGSQTEFDHVSVTNPNNASYIAELTEAEGNNSEVGREDFFVRKPSVIDVYQGRVWKERKSPINSHATASSGDYRKSLKERFSKFSRSIERMMNSPIALKNSRDPHYHVPGMTANDINFSSAGTLIATRVQSMSRLQWQGEANEQLMNQISADGYSYGVRGGWGIQLNHQWYKNGGVQVAQAAFTYSPKISVSKWISVEPSIRFKMGNKRLNSAQMENTELVELERGNAHDFYPNGGTPIGRNLWYKDLGAGMLVNTKWFFAGIQADNLSRHEDNMFDDDWKNPSRAPIHFTATIGSDWVSRDQSLSLSPYAVFQKKGNLSEVWGGANFAYEWFNIGVAASNNLDASASIGMKFDRFSLHYNADYTTSLMLDKKALSHQLTLRVVGKRWNNSNQLFKR